MLEAKCLWDEAFGVRGHAAALQCKERARGIVWEERIRPQSGSFAVALQRGELDVVLADK